jgi:hypothetical protein
MIRSGTEENNRHHDLAGYQQPIKVPTFSTPHVAAARGKVLVRKSEHGIRAELGGLSSRCGHVSYSGRSEAGGAEMSGGAIFSACVTFDRSWVGT